MAAGRHGEWNRDEINFYGQWVRPIPEDIWRQGPGQAYSNFFVGLCAEQAGILTGASQLAWGYPAGKPPATPSPMPTQ